MPDLARWLDVVGSSLVLCLLRPAGRPTPNLEEMDFYTRGEFFQEPARLYRFPDVSPPLRWSAEEMLPWGRSRSFRFVSPFTPLHAGVARRYIEYPENQTAMGELYLPRGRPRGSALYLHGWMEPSFRLEQRLLFPPMVRDAGLTVLTLAQPFHMARRPAASAFSGEFYVSADLPRTLEAFRQAVAEARSLLAWLRQETGGPVGVVGVSLGALVSALLLGGGAQPDFAILTLTPADVVLAVQRAPLLRRLREDLQVGGVTLEQLSYWARLVRPMELSPSLPAERILLVHGRSDAIAPAEAVQALWEAWGRPRLSWYDGGHFSAFLRPRPVLDRCRAFLDEVLDRGPGGSGRRVTPPQFGEEGSQVLGKG